MIVIFIFIPFLNSFKIKWLKTRHGLPFKRPNQSRDFLPFEYLSSISDNFGIGASGIQISTGFDFELIHLGGKILASKIEQQKVKFINEKTKPVGGLYPMAILPSTTYFHIGIRDMYANPVNFVFVWVPTTEIRW